MPNKEIGVANGAVKLAKEAGSYHAEAVTTLMTTSAISGSLGAGGVHTLEVGGGMGLPCTVVLKSASASRSIQLSVDGGTEFFVPSYDHASATQLVVTITAPVSHIKFVGTNGDAWRVQ